MKKLLVTSLLAIAATSAFALAKDAAYRNARKNGAIAKIEVHVVDDLGCSVSNAEVRVFMGMNFRPNGYYLNGVTDVDGMYIVEGKTCGDEIVIEVAKKGHYHSTKKLCFSEMGFEHDVEDGKWQPYGNDLKIILRRTVKPDTFIGLDKILDVAQTNVWIGFDMAKMDFVEPFGIGCNADFEVKADWDGLPAWESRRCSAQLRFVAPMCGGYYAGNIVESIFPYPYSAEPSHDYSEVNVAIVDRAGDPYLTKVPFRKNSSLVTRTRCVVDKNGELVKANYGSIRRFEIGPSRRGVALLHLSYIFNPTPNDTNLEPK